MFKKIYTAACAALLLACCQMAAAATISVAATPATPVAPASISLSVTLTDNPEAVAITQVEYFNGASSLGVSGSAPFQLDLTGMAAGSYTIVARATVDSAGNPVLVSAPLPLTISVATMTPGVYFVHTDQLNTPRVITDGTGALVWQWDSDPFGAAAPAEQPAGQAPFVNNLRFPGQYYDKETNLVHNGYRDYDPQTGRYVQSDPIGLKGGINTYAYVRGNPLRYTDPRGLNPVGGAVIGAEIGTVVFPGVGTVVGGVIGIGVGLWVGDKIIKEMSQPKSASGFPPGVWPGDKGADEWGRRNGFGQKEGRGRFHGIKQDCPGSKPTDVFGVNPETGDVFDPEGEVVGNLEDAKRK